LILAVIEQRGCNRGTPREPHGEGRHVTEQGYKTGAKPSKNPIPRWLGEILVAAHEQDRKHDTDHGEVAQDHKTPPKPLWPDKGVSGLAKTVHLTLKVFDLLGGPLLTGN